MQNFLQDDFLILSYCSTICIIVQIFIKLYRKKDQVSQGMYYLTTITAVWDFKDF